MKQVPVLFASEMKRRLRPREIVIFIVVLLIVLFFLDSGIARYGENLESRRAFQTSENRYVKSYALYTQYGTYGIRLLFIPSPFAVLYSEPVFNGLLANVNSGDRFTIYKELKGKSYFVVKSDFMTFLGIILLAAAVLCTMYGYYTPVKRNYWRFLSNFSSPARLFFALVLARILVMMCAFLVLLAASLAWLRIHRVNLFHPHLLFLLLLIFLVMVYFFCAGMVIGSLKHKLTRGVALAGLYFVSFILFPMLLELHTQAGVSGLESQFAFELRNLELIMNVERRLNERFGKFKSGGIAPPDLVNSIKGALDREFKILFRREQRHREELRARIEARHRAAWLYPVLFYQVGVEEVSSCGGLSYLDFSRFCQQRKKEFIDFYVRKKFLKSSRAGDVENFIKGDENLFYAGSHLPYGAWFGVLISCLYLVLGLMLSYRRFLRLLAPKIVKESTAGVKIALKRGTDNNIDSPDLAAANHLFSILSGKAGDFSGEVIIDDKSLSTSPGKRQDFFYVCSPADLPGEFTVNAFIRLLKGLMKLTGEQAGELNSVLRAGTGKTRLEDLPDEETLQLLVQVMELRPSDIYLLIDLANRCSMDFSTEFARKMRRLKGRNCIILYISGSGTCLLFKADHYFVYTYNGARYEWEEAKDSRTS
jgi:hypothetical protein